jgi:DNA-binding transcriptional ArsR family regulator
VRHDVAPEELANYCLHALAAARSLPSKAVVRQLVKVTLTECSPGTAIWPRSEASCQTSVRVHLPFVLTNQDAGLTALGDHTRRAIVACLAERPRAVSELADELPVSRPAVSQHLKVLKDAGLVTDRAAGTRRIYRLNPAGIGALRDQLETFWNRALASYKDVVEEPREESS